MEGNPFVAPQERFLPQVNEEFAPRPELKSFTNSPFIGVSKQSPIAPNSDNEVSQKKTVMDWMQEIRTHKYFPLALAGIIVLVVMYAWGGRKGGYLSSYSADYPLSRLSKPVRLPKRYR